jgi:hypothetical protein
LWVAANAFAGATVCVNAAIGAIAHLVMVVVVVVGARLLKQIFGPKGIWYIE